MATVAEIKAASKISGIVEGTLCSRMYKFGMFENIADYFKFIH